MHKVFLSLLYSVCVVTFFLVSCSKDNDNSTPPESDIEIDYIKNLGGSKNESAKAVVKTTDGGYAI